MISQTKPKVRAFGSPDMAQTLHMQMQALLQEQADFLAETQKAMAAFTKRRQEAMDANFKSFAAMGVCSDPAAMSAAYSEWLTGSMDRIFQDIDSVRQEALRVAEMGQKSMTALFWLRDNTTLEKDAWLEPAMAPLPRRRAAE